MTTKKTGLEREKEKERGKRRFLERIQEEKEADEEIKDFVPECIQYPDNDEDVHKM
jgi:hypothetical protein